MQAYNGVNDGRVGRKLAFFKIDPNAKFPVRKRAGDAGFDLYSLEQVELKPLERKLVRTGIGVILPPGYVGLIKDRSGLAVKGLHVLGGVIDENYRGEIKVILINLSDEPIVLPAFSRIAQLLVLNNYIDKPIYLNVLPESERNTERKDKGFGSSGIF